MDEDRTNKKVAEQELNQTMPKGIEDLLQRVDALPILDSRSEDEILGYGENGNPPLMAYRRWTLRARRCRKEIILDLPHVELA